ncbi:MAG: hypothetical protein LC770_05795, partial [Acidobacteria bacterium]|nr:hypothetical protein [Acidobacteriota bacterium]
DVEAGPYFVQQLAHLFSGSNPSDSFCWPGAGGAANVITRANKTAIGIRLIGWHLRKENHRVRQFSVLYETIG